MLYSPVTSIYKKSHAISKIAHATLPGHTGVAPRSNTSEQETSGALEQGGPAACYTAGHVLPTLRRS